VALPERFKELAAEVSNWGRWGDDDERGTLNLIDAEAVRRGSAAASSGRIFSLAVPFDKTPQVGGAPGRFDPIHTMISINSTYTGDTSDACWNDDQIILPLSAGTHIDALAHVSYEGLIYNGFAADSVRAPGGATRCGADKLGPVISRGVLLDVARVHGVDRLDPGYAITAADLDAAVEQARTDVLPGDVVLLRTCQMKLLHAGKVKEYNHDSPGPSSHTIRWFRQHDVAAVFDDTYVFEVWPPEDWAAMMVVHMIHIRDMGLVQGQIFDLEALAADCADDGRYTVLLTAAPEPVVGGCSAPVHPVAVK
jgi:kynurenine formamidase